MLLVMGLGPRFQVFSYYNLGLPIVPFTLYGVVLCLDFGFFFFFFFNLLCFWVVLLISEFEFNLKTTLVQALQQTIHIM